MTPPPETSPGSPGPRPPRRRLAIFLVVPMLAILIALGTWQLDRRAWKAELIDRIETGLAQPPEDLPERIAAPDAWNWRRVRAEGRFDHAAEMHLVGRTLDGQLGVHLVTPLIRAQGEAVLVDRGWAPLADDASAGLIDRPEGPVVVEGVARLPDGPGWMQPANDPATNQWFWIDPAAMAGAADLDAVAPVVIEAAADPGAGVGWPRGGRTRIDLPNNHLQYALFWYAFAGILLTIFLLDRRRR